MNADDVEKKSTTEQMDTSTWPEKLEYAPIMICVYMRLDLIRNTIEALKRNTLAPKSALFLFSDAPGHPEHAEGIREVRSYLHTVTGFKHVILVEREKNFGPLNNFTDALGPILDRYDRYIEIEEDIVTSPYFLQYMNDALAVYKDDPRVVGVASCKLPFPDDPDRKEVFFMQYFNPWGNAMWKKWRENTLRYEAPELLQKLYEKKLLAKFDSYSSFIVSNSRMLRMTAARKMNALDITLSGNVLLRDGYIVYPPRSMSNHMGFGSGVHCTVETTDYLSELANEPARVTKKEVREDPLLVKRFHSWLLRVHLKLLFKYLFTLGPIRNLLKAKYKNREF